MAKRQIKMQLNF